MRTLAERGEVVQVGCKTAHEQVTKNSRQKLYIKAKLFFSMYKILVQRIYFLKKKVKLKDENCKNAQVLFVQLHSPKIPAKKTCKPHTISPSPSLAISHRPAGRPVLPGAGADAGQLDDEPVGRAGPRSALGPPEAGEATHLAGPLHDGAGVDLHAADRDVLLAVLLPACRVTALLEQ